jgi:hypothetical protein
MMDSTAIGTGGNYCMALENHYYLTELEMFFLPGDSGTTVRHNTQKYTYHIKYCKICFLNKVIRI